VPRARGLVALGESGLGLVGQLVALGLQLLGLDLDALARGGDVGDGALDLGQVLELLFVGEIERLARVFHLVERGVGLRLKNCRDSLTYTHGGLLRYLNRLGASERSVR